MFSDPVSLDLEVETVNVMGDRSQYTLDQNVLFPTIPVLPESHILFYDSKASLRLDTPVHTELYPIIAGDPPETGFLLPLFVMRGVYNIFSHRKGIPKIQIFRDTFLGMAYRNLDLSSCSRSSAIGVNVWYFLQITYMSLCGASDSGLKMRSLSSLVLTSLSRTTA